MCVGGQCAPLTVIDSDTRNVTAYGGDIVTVTCDEGYTASSGASFDVSCSNDINGFASPWLGVWSTPEECTLGLSSLLFS